jgi:hypothetical protein
MKHDCKENQTKRLQVISFIACLSVISGCSDKDEAAPAIDDGRVNSFLMQEINRLPPAGSSRVMFALGQAAGTKCGFRSQQQMVNDKMLYAFALTPKSLNEMYSSSNPEQYDENVKRVSMDAINRVKNTDCSDNYLISISKSIYQEFDKANQQ